MSAEREGTNVAEQGDAAATAIALLAGGTSIVYENPEAYRSGTRVSVNSFGDLVVTSPGGRTWLVKGNPTQCDRRTKARRRDR